MQSADQSKTYVFSFFKVKKHPVLVTTIFVKRSVCLLSDLLQALASVQLFYKKMNTYQLVILISGINVEVFT